MIVTFALVPAMLLATYGFLKAREESLEESGSAVPQSFNSSGSVPGGSRDR